MKTSKENHYLLGDGGYILFTLNSFPYSGDMVVSDEIKFLLCFSVKKLQVRK